MAYLTILARDIPWVMAPASLIAAIAVFSALVGLFRLTQLATRTMILGLMTALTAGAVLLQVIG